MYPTSVLLRKGHRIRVALAGADASLFEQYPAEGTPKLTVYREAQRASDLNLPVKTHDRRWNSAFCHNGYGTERIGSKKDEFAGVSGAALAVAPRTDLDTGALSAPTNSPGQSSFHRAGWYQG